MSDFYEKLINIYDIKQQIMLAIQEKKPDVYAGMKFADYPDAIKSITIPAVGLPFSVSGSTEDFPDNVGDVVVYPSLLMKINTGIGSDSYSDAVHTTAIAPRLFEGWYQATGLIIESGFTEIGDRAFYGWDEAVSLVIPETITSIGDNAFANWNMLQSVTCRAVIPPPSCGDLPIGDTVPIYVPADSVEVYKTVWPNYAASITAIV